MKKTLLSVLCLMFSMGLFAQSIPHEISYQGKLLNNGTPVTGSVSITFTIGSWTETHPSVQVKNGLYSVTLGETNPIPASIFENSSSVKLKVSVNGSTLSPQTQILSVPYAYKAEKAQNSNSVGGNAVSSASPSTGQVLKWDGTKWAPGTDNSGGVPSGTAGGDLRGDYPNPTVVKIQGQQISTISPSNGQILKWDGSRWTPSLDATGGLALPYKETYSGTAGTAFSITTKGNTGGISAFSNGTATAVWGGVSSSSGSSAGVYGITYSSTGYGVYGTANTSSGLNCGVYGQSLSGNGVGVYGHVSANNSNAIAIYGWASYSSAYAGYFTGNVEIDGNLNVNGSISKSSGTFKIDDPADPANKFLYHSFVESPDMMNVYNGNVTTNAKGIAVVQLPDYFDALNKDFRYQLTVIGVFSQAIVYKKIRNNQFTIKTDKPNVEVSWQVTGIRKDPYANAHRVIPVVEKSAKEKGHYLDYKDYNQPYEKSIEAIDHPQKILRNGGK